METTRDFATGLRSGIFDRRHFKAIGIALWTFAWCVDRQTDAAGWVLGGKTLTYQEIASSVGLLSRKQAEGHISKLVRGGYIVCVSDGTRGNKLRIVAPKKALSIRSPRGVEGSPRGAEGSPRGAEGSPRGAEGPYKERDSGRLKGDSRTPPTPETSPEDLYAFASDYGFRMVVLNGAFLSGQNAHLFVDVLRLGESTLRACLEAISQRAKRYQPGSARAWIDALLAEAAKASESASEGLPDEF